MSSVCTRINQKYVNTDADAIERSFRRHYADHARALPTYGYAQGLSESEWWSRLGAKVFGEQPQFVKELDSAVELSKCLYDEFAKPAVWQVYPNCERTLERLRREGFKLAVVSNFDTRLPKILTDMQLNKWFEFLLVPSMLNGIAKPDKVKKLK